MNQPRPGQVFKKEPYWARVEATRPEGARLPEEMVAWCFNFISVHHSSLQRQYSLVSPMSLVDERTGKRPEFEADRFGRKADAVAFAREIGRVNGCHVLDCCQRTQ